MLNQGMLKIVDVVGCHQFQVKVRCDFTVLIKF